MEIQACNRCSKRYPVTEKFFRSQIAPSGKKYYYRFCHDCRRIAQRKDYRIHKEKRQEYNRQYFLRRRELGLEFYKRLKNDPIRNAKRAERSRKWQRDNRELLRQRFKVRYKNSEILRAKRREYHSKNKERVHRVWKIYYGKNKKSLISKQLKNLKKYPHLRITKALRDRLRQVLLSQGVTKSKHTMDLVGCSSKDLRKYIESLFLPNMTWENYGRKDGEWSIDHIKPCASFNLQNVEQQKQCFHYTNLQPMWHKNNREKNSFVNGVRITCKNRLSQTIH